MVSTDNWSSISGAFVIASIGLMIAYPTFGQTQDEILLDRADQTNETEQTEETEKTDEVDEIDESEEAEQLDEVEIDVQGSVGDAEERRGFGLDGDLRLGYVFAGENFQDVAFGETDLLRTRWRVRSVWGISEQLRGVARVAGTCSTNDCKPEVIFQPEISTPTGLSDGQITIDSLFLQWFRTEKFDVAIGRMETKFVARGGVYSKSLDRNDSNNLRINWTDGALATYKALNGWVSSMVLQYNSADGASNIRRSPLDFSDGRSRVSTFFAFENVQPKRRLVQRAFDVTYMPSSLLQDGIGGRPAEDYWAFVARAAARWPVRSEGWRLRISSEVGYAPVTPSKFAAGIVGAGDAGGLAWNITASIMDFLPQHSIGVNYARTEAGWLISPQYTDNEQLLELRYVWRPTDRLTLDVRGRWRDELIQRVLEEPRRDPFDFYARITWSFTARRLAY
jgi:hypothetical protein